MCVCCTSAAKKDTKQFSLICINPTNEGKTVMSASAHSLAGLLQVSAQDLPDLFLTNLGELRQCPVLRRLLGLDVPGKHWR